ncbi:BspA family leucine-rich repeat surface protein [Aquimarina algiphila]|nr:BspA family leucine-rich repeat surface protein [Aquimarina algiphila]
MKHFYITLFFIVSFCTAGFAQNEFITTWETTTADESITIPTTGSGYNYTVDWGDGTIETGFTGNATHEYAVADIYTVKITGDFPRIYFNNNADSDKILTVEQWGNIAWTSMENAFNDCKKLRIKATDAPDLSRVTNLRNAFRACQAFRDEDFSNWDVSNVTNMPFVFFASSFNGDVSTWDVGSVTNFISTFAISPFNQNISSWNIGERVTGTINMGGMFLRGRQFNQNLGSWDISKVSNMNNMFSQSSLSTTNYDATLIGWATQDPGETIPSNISISFEGSQYCLGADARNTLTDPTGLNWSITDDGVACASTDFFITTWQTTTDNENIVIPTTGSGYDYSVDWGDGTIETGFTGNATHEYTTSGTYTVRIIGDFPRIYFNNSGDKDKILEVNQWGSIAWNGFNDAFSGCSNLDVIATDAPDLSNVTSVSRMFRECTTLGTSSMLDFSNWDTSSVVVFGGMFRNASNFNSTSITNWDVGKATGFVLMFENAITFNQDISNWNIGENVTGTVNLGSMLIGAENFDQNLGAWNLEKVTNIRNMLNDTGLSTANYDATLIGWAENSNTPSGLDLGASSLTYCLGEAARNILTDAGRLNWTISDGGLGCAATDFFVTTWRTTSSERRITIPTTGGGYDYTVDWGDGTIETGFTGNASHSYATPGIHTVKIIGDFPRIYFFIAASRNNIRSIEQWGTISWTNMEFAFAGCENLVLNADDVPDLSLVEDLSSMFLGASNFVDNKDKMNSWDISNVRDLEQMFENAVSFNEPLHNWDTSNVENMDFMFFLASSFDQSLGDWNLSNAFSLLNILNFSGISSENYDATLIGWAEQGPGDTIVPRRGLGTIRTSYCLGTDARRILTSAPHNWSITDQGQDCDFTNAFVTTWQTTTADEDITIPSTGAGYNYIVDWGDGTAITSETGNATHTYTSAGAYEVKIIGDFPRIYFNNSGDKDKILAVNQWGAQQWTSMENAFYGCSNLVLDATDTPILSQANNVSRMFNSAISLVDTQDVMNTWDVSTITTMERMFADADMFNENIASWNVGNVQNFSVMFGGADNFNQNVNDWNIGAFVTGAVNIDFMFIATASFNQPLNNWDVSKVNRFNYTFSGAAKFNQDLSDWDISSVNSMLGMLDYSGMSIENYEATLKGWATDTSGNVSDGIDDIPTGVRLGVIQLKYCAVEEGRNILTNTLNNWNIIGDVLDCGFEEGFITTWQTTAADETIVIPTRGDGYNYSVAWGDGTEDISITGDASHTFTTPGTYTVKIKGDFPRIRFNSSIVDNQSKIQTIEQWGTQKWDTFTSGFNGCVNLKLNADDVPDLSQATQLSSMFEGCTNFEDLKDRIGSWDVSTIERIDSMFTSCSIFNEDISAWTFTNLLRTDSVFEEALAFNQNISNWNMATVMDMAYMFYDATAFNQPIGNWTLGTVEYMMGMFSGATTFNQDLSNWNFSQVQDIEELFSGASSFDQDLSNWDISNVTNMAGIFTGTAMSQENYDNTLIGWATLEAGETRIPTGLTLNADVAHCLSVDAINTLTSLPYSWMINDGGKICPEDAFITSWLLEDNDRITIRTTSGYNYRFNIDWGDGTKDTNVTTDISHVYTTAGTYEVSITGEFPRFTLLFRFGKTLRTKIQTIEQWGNIQWRSFRDSFNDCENLKLNADDTPDLSQVTELSRMFEKCTNFEDLKDRMGSWDVSTIERIDNMFTSCSIFNEDISAWTFTNLLTAEASFQEAVTFNQNISSWNMVTVIDMENMFDNASSFDQNLSSWDISNVEELDNIFTGSGMSTENYDKTLIGWATLEAGETEIPTGLTLDADATFCLAEAARDTLTGSLYNWIINDGGFGCPTPVITLIGDNPQTITLGDMYTEPGAEVTHGAVLTIDISDVDTNLRGMYSVTYNATSASGEIAAQVTRIINVIDSCPIVNLPENNFTLTTASETCTDKNNGMISISATEPLNYIATINNEAYNFTSNLVIPDLAPDTYNFCIAIDGVTNCEQCFELTIEEAAVVTGKTTLDSNTMNIEMASGTAPYMAMINDKVVGEYTSNTFAVKVQHGDVLDIVSSLACEGKLSARVDLFDKITITPNPTQGDVILTVPNGGETMNVTIHNTLGMMVSSGVYSIINSKVNLPMESLSAGIYFVRIEGSVSEPFKIVKQ